MKRIRIKDKEFKVFIPSEEIQKKIEEVAVKINTELDGKRPLFLAVLNGSFLFAADLMKRLTIDCEISFIKVASYHGTSSSGTVKHLIGLSEDIKGRTVVVLEDIIDTGLTIENLQGQIMKKEPAELKFATLLFKPDAYTRTIHIDYIGLEVPNHFLVGYGLDYDGLGRNMEDIFVLDSGTHGIAINPKITMLNIVLFGPPGAGKGTQSEKLINKYNLVHLSTGDILRSEITAGTPLGMEAKKLMDQGQLVPDEVVIGMIRSKLEQNKNAKGFIFDGFPRTVPQAMALDKLLAEMGTSITMMLALEVDDEELTKRLLLRGKDSGRSDDQDEAVIRNRIKEYNNKTAPLKEYYSRQGKFHSIHGIGEIDEIFAHLCSVVNKAVH